MKTYTSAQTRADTRPLLTSTSHAVVQRCSCGGRPGPSGQCAECRRKRLGLQRKARSSVWREQVPGIVHSVLRQSGQPLDTETQSFMQARLGHDFSNVRVHTDVRAAESAGAVDARAYTVGQHIVFNREEYNPGTREGRQLLAHELVHVMQQAGSGFATVRGIADPAGTHEHEADRLSSHALSSHAAPVEVHQHPAAVARLGGKCLSAKIGYWAAFAAAVASCGAAIITSETGIGLVLLGAACVASIIAFIGAIVALIECMESDPDADRREIERLRQEQERMERRLRQVEEFTGSGS